MSRVFSSMRRYTGYLRGAILWFPRWLSDLYGVIVGFVHLKQSYVVERSEGRQQLAGAKRVAVFVHFDRRSKVQQYVLYYLEQLVQAGFAVVFVTSSSMIEPESLLNVLPRCAVLLKRRNFGHDFGGYKDGLTEIGDVSVYDQLLLVNDSVYGPFFDLSTLLARCNNQAAIWGITDSWDQRFHLQSYFLLINKPALQDRRFSIFWRHVRYLGSRRSIIRRYEIGFTQTMLAADLRCTALFPYRRSVEAISAAALKGQLYREDLSSAHRDYLERVFNAVEQGIPLNVTHFFWDYLIGELGCPFLKRDLLLRNPMGVPFINQWQLLLQRRSRYDTDMILHDLESALRHRSI
jgi:hypothetical protein